MKRGGGGGKGGAIFRNRQPRNANPYPATRNAAAYSRVSDASLASSRPSTVGVGGRLHPPTDKFRQSEALSSINGFLGSRDSSLCLKAHPVSSSKEITETLIFVLSQLGYEITETLTKLEDEILFVLKRLNCPFKISKTAIRASNTPHNWPSFLAVIHWLVQIAIYADRRNDSFSNFVNTKTSVSYPLESYIHFLNGHDDQVAACDNDYREILEKERDARVKNVGALEIEADELAKKLEELKNEPTEKEKLEKEDDRLETDCKKFEEANTKIEIAINTKEKSIGETSKALNVKLEELRRIDEENRELKIKLDQQTVSARDVEKMKRELMNLEKEILDTEESKVSWEEKNWKIDTEVKGTLKEMEELAIKCNQTMRRLKHGNNVEYVINPTGSKPADVIGIDYKETIKPEIAHFETELKKNTMSKLNETVTIQKQLADLSAKIEGKRVCIQSLPSQIEEIENEISMIRKGIEDYRHKCDTEAKRMMEQVQLDTQNVNTLGREAEEFLKATTSKLQDTTRLYDEQIQIEARELFSVVDIVSNYKGHVESHVQTMKKKLLETAQAVTNTYQNSLAAQIS